MPTYLTFDEFETSVGGEEALKLIADPTFTNEAADVDLVEQALDWAEGEVLRYSRAAPATSGLASWVDDASSLPAPARAAIVTLATYHLHEVIRGSQGVAIPKGSIDAKVGVYASFEGLVDGSISWSAAAAPARTLTQKVRVYTDASASGRRARSAQVRKLIG